MANIVTKVVKQCEKAQENHSLGNLNYINVIINRVNYFLLRENSLSSIERFKKKVNLFYIIIICSLEI